jgi:hypothetical protein
MAIEVIEWRKSVVILLCGSFPSKLDIKNALKSSFSFSVSKEPVLDPRTKWTISLSTLTQDGVVRLLECLSICPVDLMERC